MRVCLALFVVFVFKAPTGLCDDDAAGIAFFEKKIRLVLVQHCYECHSSQAKQSKAGLLLDTRAGIRRGGESGPAVVPGDIDASLLISAIKYEGYEMPPKQRLPAAVIDDFANWIKMGAPDPRSGGTTVPEANATTDVSNFWSFQPMGNPKVPAVSTSPWPKSPIDSFILTRLDRESLQPALDATPEVLIRRLYVDLIGLPPTPDELENRRKQLSAGRGESAGGLNQQGVSELVDHLLSSPLFGERWGRHWLDLARYADSTGGGNSTVLPDAWKYRDYVIESFNNDTPYDEFIREQIAGDLMPAADVEQRTQNLVATGFLVLGPRSYITDDPAAFLMDGVDEQVDTIGRVFLGMTVGCSRCHDHKFDSISHADYHALAGILKSTLSAESVPLSKNYTWSTVADPREDPDGLLLANYNAASQRLKTVLKANSLLKRAVELARKTGKLPADTDVDSARSIEQWITDQQEVIEANTAKVANLRNTIPPKPATLMAVRCEDEPSDMRIRLRGNPHKTGEMVPRGFPQVISKAMANHPTQPKIPVDQSGRLELADWLASSKNPLTARVFVNRVWLHLFGRGIVATPDNFGTTGTLPTHPELLDWLAQRFISDGWSIKTLIRNIVMSRVYQSGCGHSLDADPENVLFGRRTRRSLDAETLRDTMLAVSGELDCRSGGPSFPGKLRIESSHAFQSRRRSVYVPRFRNNPLELFQVFDAANSALVVGQRDETILPTQALFLINNDFVIERSNASAQRILRDEQPTIDDKIRLLYLRTLCRAPSSQEAALAREFVEGATGEPRIEIWSTLQQTLFECVDFRFVK